ncbi:MAG: hypothetical protein ACAF41_16465 [Leptolyngbya sp. BL-A-14]
MLYLAQVQKKGLLGKSGLQLLARQKSENAWTLLLEEETILATEASNFSESMFVLVELGPSRQVLSVYDAKPWLLDIVQKFLVNGITPEFLQQETERAEQWRQSLTLQSQELDRRALELEARKEQIQEMEEKLKREKRVIDAHTSELEARKEQIQEMEEKLKREKKW